MSYDTKRAELGREPISFVEMDLDLCQNVFGVSPCTATGEKCYNTKATCKDNPNYLNGTTTYRFTDSNALLPDTGLTFPCVKRISYTPTKLSFGDGLGYRGKVTITMRDFSYHDGGIDPYLSSRTHDTSQGTFWGKFLNRNKYYNGRIIRIKTGYYSDPFDWLNFETREYIIENITGPDSKGNVTIQGKDILKKMDSKRVKVPALTDGKLLSDITSTATTINLTSGDGVLYPLSGALRIDDEIIDYSRTDKYQGTITNLVTETTVTAITDGYNVVWTSPYNGASNEYLGFGIDSLGTGNIILEFTATINSGSLVFSYYESGTGWVVLPNGNHTVVDGVNRIEMPLRSSGALYQTITSTTVTDADIDFTNINIYSSDTIDNVTRAQYGTIADSHSAEASVQLCKIYDANVVDIIYDLLTTYGGISSTYIPYDNGATGIPDEWDNEKTDWLIDKNFYAVLSEPEGAQKLLEELTDQALTLLWWDDAMQKIRLKAIAPLEPTVTATLLTDELNIIEDSMKVKEDVDNRYSQIWVNYGVRDWSKSSDREDFQSVTIHADLTQEASDKYDDSRVKSITSRWFTSDIQADVYATMYMIASKDAPKDVTLRVDAKDKLSVGDYIDVQSRLVQDEFGASAVKRYYVTESKDIGGDQFELTLRTAWYDDDSWIYIAPDTAHDYASATDEERKLYWYFTDDNGLNPDGTVGDKII